jgi:AcrR family transcriptional regulator
MDLADKGGIEALTMRKLAERLGVEPMSLYYHVASKDELLSGIIGLAEGEIEIPADDLDWKTAIRRMAISFHDVLKRHPWAASLPQAAGVSPASVSPARLRYMESVLGRLREAGFSANMTHHAYHALDSHIVGSTLWHAGYASIKGFPKDIATTFARSLPVETYPYLLEHIEQHVNPALRDGKSEFEFGLDLILDSLERLRTAKVKRTRSPRKL